MVPIIRVKNIFKRIPFASGFTLMEIIIVVITLAVIASVALNSYTKVVQQSECREIKLKLIEIHNLETVADLTGIDTLTKIDISQHPQHYIDFGPNMARIPPHTAYPYWTIRTSYMNCKVQNYETPGFPAKTVPLSIGKPDTAWDMYNPSCMAVGAVLGAPQFCSVN